MWPLDMMRVASLSKYVCLRKSINDIHQLNDCLFFISENQALVEIFLTFCKCHRCKQSGLENV